MGKTMEKGFKKIGVTVSKPILAVITIILGIVVIVLPDLLVWYAHIGLSRINIEKS